jgi:hypothetical protein
MHNPNWKPGFAMAEAQELLLAVWIHLNIKAN